MYADDKHVSIIFKALNFAAAKHRDHRRKGQHAAPYINHLIDVADILWNIGQVRDISILIAGILHDTLEDTDTTPAEIVRGFGPQVLSIVEEVTDDKSLPKEVRKRLQVEHAATISPEARQLKLADKIANVRELVQSPPAGWSRQRQRDYVSWSEEVVEQLRGCNARLEHHFNSVVQDAREQLGNYGV